MSPAYVESATITIAASDPLSGLAGVEYELDGAPGSGTAVRASTLGTHTLRYRARDVVGNVGAWSLPQTFAVVPAIQPTTVSIRTNVTSRLIGQTATLSGAMTPAAVVGRIMAVYVLKPGSPRWSYSSNRVVYALNGSAAWQYKYLFKRGMTKSVYKYKAVFPAVSGFAGSASPNTVSVRLK